MRAEERRVILRRVSACWCRLAAACALLAIAATPAAADAHPLTTGLSGLDSYEPLALQQASAAGIRMVRISVPWAGVAPGQEPASWQPEDPADPNYGWTSVDAAVRATVEAGLTPVATVEGAPSWAQRCQLQGANAGRLCDPDPAKLAAFAVAAASRYSGNFEGLPRVRFWQGLNEANLSLFFNPQYERGRPVSPLLFRKLANAFYFAVKSVDPSDLVIAAGLGPIAVKHLTIGPLDFTRRLLCMRGRRHPHPAPGNCEGGVHFDIFDIHPYTTGGPSHRGGPDDVELGGLGKLRELIRAANRAGRIKGQSRYTPIWITEFSWDSKPPDPGGLQMRIEVRWTAEALFVAWRAGISNFFWFTLRDFPRESRPFADTYQSGLYFRGPTVAQDRPKKVMYAFRFPFVAYPHRNGLTFWGRTPDSGSGRILIQLRRHGHWRRVAVVHADRNGIFRGRARILDSRRRGSASTGAVRARFGRELSPAFSLRPVKDFYQPPFGKRVR
jgi:hypothetical protein